MLRLRSILAILILLLACAFQFWFASTGVFINFILATLIVFAFFFETFKSKFDSIQKFFQHSILLYR